MAPDLDARDDGHPGRRAGRRGGSAAPDDATFALAAEAALADATPLAHNGYKLPLARGLIARALRAVAG